MWKHEDSMERLTVPEGDIAAVFALRSFGDRSELCTLLIKDVHAGQRRHSSFRLIRKGIEDILHGLDLTVEDRLLGAGEVVTNQ